MKRLTLIFSFFLIGILVLPINAQMMKHNQDSTSAEMNQSGMMSGGMMGGNQNQSGMMMNRQGGMMGNMMQGGMMGGMQGMGMMNQNMPIKKYMMMINKLPNMGQALSLTDEQTKQLMSMQTDFLKKKIDYQAAIDKKKIDMKNLLDNDASSSEVRSTMQEIANSKIDMHVNAYETANKMKNMLNAQQKQTLKNWMMNSGGMMGGGMMQNGMMQGSGMQQGGMMNNSDRQKSGVMDEN